MRWSRVRRPSGRDIGTYSTPGTLAPVDPSVRTTRTSAKRANIDTRPCTRAPNPPRSGSALGVMISTRIAHLRGRGPDARIDERIDQPRVRLPVELPLDELAGPPRHRPRGLGIGERLPNVADEVLVGRGDVRMDTRTDVRNAARGEFR